MVSEETAKRIADALERLDAAVERSDVAAAMAAVPDDVRWSDVQYTTRILPTIVPPFICYRCIPAHVLDQNNPCKSYGGLT